MLFKTVFKPANRFRNVSRLLKSVTKNTGRVSALILTDVKRFKRPGLGGGGVLAVAL